MMRSTPFFILFVLWMGCQTKPEEDIESQSLMLFDFEDSKSRGDSILSKDASFEYLQKDHNTVLRVKSGYTVGKPGVVLYRNQKNNWDLTGYYQIKADVTNESEDDMQVEMFVGNDPDGLVRWFCSDYVDLDPGQTKTVTVNLSWTPWAFNPQLDIKGLRGVPGEIKTDVNAIDQLSFNARFSTSTSEFSVDNVRAEGILEQRDTTGFFPFVDEFGQYKHEDWKNKIHEVSDLKRLDSLEKIELAKWKEPEGRSQYGGWKNGPQLEATGFFRTEKYEGKWWMVDPEGYLFWTAGLNCVSSRSSVTGIEHRENYFENLHPDDEEYGPFYGTSNWSFTTFYEGKTPYKTYSFYQSNLYKKFGEDWLDLYRDRIHDRLRSWGLNTIGFVSDFGAALQDKTPYVGSIWIRNTPKIEGSKGYWGKFHDVFDPEFRQIVKKSMQDQKTGAGDPWCLGFFVDNELSWGLVGSLSVGTLESPASQPAKIEFVNDLKAKYSSIDQLNAQWGAEHKSWDELLTSTEASDQEKAKEDLELFYGKIATTYFRIIKEELDEIAPNQNYLGCRFAWANNDITLKAAATYADIVSFNKYEFSVEKVSLPEGVDHPIMIGEFHFGSTDRGMAHPGVRAVANQEERGVSYENYIQGALRNEQIVGAHWFQYLDEPFTGRGDGENYNVGFVDVGDTPHEELISSVRKTCYSLYEYRTKN